MKIENLPQVKELLGVPADEPVFVLRAHDRLALDAIDGYRMACAQQGCSPKFVQGLDEIIRDFDNWYRTHSVKTPD